MEKRNLLLLLALLCILIIAGALTYVIYKTPNDALNSNASQDLLVSQTAVYTDLEGNPFTFEEYEGKVRVVNAWASWSPFSHQELKDLETLAREYEDKEVVFIAINRKESKEQAKSYLATIQEFTKMVFAIDVTDAFYTAIKGYAMPETVFYDVRGNIVFHKRGNMTLEEIREHIEATLRAQP
jgi:cytochrome c biogenesis protein CcmG, thiol:disulfide interchange protein DsbE